MKLIEDLNNDLRTVSKVLAFKIKIATDELRKEGSKFYTQHCQLEREKQLMDKQKRTE